MNYWIFDLFVPFFQNFMQCIFDFFTSQFFWVLFTPILLLLPLKIILSLCNK